MKKKQVEKRIKSEIERFAPSDFLSVRQKIEARTSALSAQENCEIESQSGGTAAIKRKKIPFPPLAAATALALALILILSAAISALFNKGDENPVIPAPAPLTGGSFFIDVNPSLELDYDAEGNILSARGLNDDGKVLLSGWDAAGKSVNECVNEVFSRCVAQGYFTACNNNNAVLVTAESAEGTRDETRTQEIKNLFCQAFETNKIRGVVITGVSDSESEEEAKEYGVDGQKYSLIQYYLSLGGTLDSSRYSTVSIKELYELIEKIGDKEKDELEDLCESIADDLEEKFDALEKEVKTALKNFAPKNFVRKLEAERLLKEMEAFIGSLDDAELFGCFSAQFSPEEPSFPYSPQGNNGKDEENGEDGIAGGGFAVSVFLNKAERLAQLLKDEGQSESAQSVENFKAEAEERLSEWESCRGQLRQLQDFETRREKKEEEIKNRGDKDKKEDDDFDYDGWQKNKEKEFMKNWYRIKESGGANG